MTNLVHHLKVKHAEKYAKYHELKTANNDKQHKESHSSNRAAQLRQISLAETAECCKVWDINDSQAKVIHTRVREMIAIDYESFVNIYGNKNYINIIIILHFYAIRLR